MNNDKQFVGKVFEKTFNNGGSIIRLSLTPNDLDIITKSMSVNDKGFEQVGIAIKKSQKGKWYAEIDTYVPKAVTTNTEEQADGLPF